MLLEYLAIVVLSSHCAVAQTSGTFIKTGDLNVPRVGHTATLLNDGRVLIAGGRSMTKGVVTPLSSAELYDPASGTFSLTGNMTTGRSYHTATVLFDGRVLITGGDDGNYEGITSAELYDPATGTFSAAGHMSEARGAATLLSTGKVLLSGANDRSLELYDPATGTFGPTGYVSGSAYGIPATRLLNGDVLLGGYAFGPDAAVYNTATGNVQALTFPDLVHVLGYSETLLANGKVLLAGGLTSGRSGYISYTYLYDPTTQSFQTTGSMVAIRGYHSATLLRSGLVLVTGGYTGTPETDYASAELYDPAGGTFAKAGAMTRPRANHTATLLRDGRVLMVGGELLSGDPGGPASTAELYVPDGFPASNCGKYPTVEGNCRRIAILPWYAAIPGQWETDLDLSSSFSAVRFGYIMSAAFTYDGIGHNLLVAASDHAGTFIGESVDGIKGTYSARILGGEDCNGQFGCQAVSSLGSLVITIDGPNAMALDSADVRATHKLLASDGAVLGQADAPVVFRDQDSSKWSASITDTPLSKQAQPGATVLSFAVANLDAGAQAVNVRVFDASGKLVGSATTPVLNGAASLGPPFGDADAVGGVYAVTLSDLLGTDLTPSAGEAVFHGTVTFEGAAGWKIAPLVVQMNWPSITSIPAKPE